MFRAHVLIIRRSKLHYTASGIITPVGVMTSWWWSHVLETCRYDDTRGRVMQFCPPDDEHMWSKHVEAWNKLTVKQKFCASSWLITEINILRSTVSKTSKIPLHVSSTIVLIFRRTIVLVQHLVSSLSLGDCSVHRLREDGVCTVYWTVTQRQWRYQMLY